VSISYLWNRLHRNDNALLEYGFFQQVASLTRCDADCSTPTFVRYVGYVRNPCVAELPGWFHSLERLDALVQLCVTGSLVWCVTHTAAEVASHASDGCHC
jgi:hypothetical protein